MSSTTKEEKLPTTLGKKLEKKDKEQEASKDEDNYHPAGNVDYDLPSLDSKKAKWTEERLECDKKKPKNVFDFKVGYIPQENGECEEFEISGALIIEKDGVEKEKTSAVQLEDKERGYIEKKMGRFHLSSHQDPNFYISEKLTIVHQANMHEEENTFHQEFLLDLIS